MTIKGSKKFQNEWSIVLTFLTALKILKLYSTQLHYSSFHRNTKIYFLSKNPNLLEPLSR